MRRSVAIALALAVAGAVVAFAIPAAAQDSSSSDQSILRIGWAQDPQTLNPFVGLDEEDYNVWAMNWDLLVNFDPEDLSPAPGIAKSWTVSDDKKTITFKLDPEAKWSDGEPITSTDVKWSLETLGDEGDLFTNYTSNVTRIDTPDDYTVVVHTSKPDARIIGGLFIYILPEHIWGKVPLKDLTGQYKPELPLVGSPARSSSPSTSTGGSSGWSATRTSAAPSRPTTRSSSSSTAPRTRSSGPCSSARSTW